MAGRRPGNSGSREEILAAARRLFAERGYDGTTIRAVAADAGVNPALVHHFFGSKEQMFMRAVDFPVDPFEVLPRIVEAGPVQEFGLRLAGLMVEVWEDEQRRAPLLALLRGAMTGEPGARTLRGMAEQILITRVEQLLGTARVVTAAAFAQMVGIMLGRYVFRIEALVALSPQEVVARLAPIIQTVADDSGADSVVDDSVVDDCVGDATASDVGSSTGSVPTAPAGRIRPPVAPND